MKLMTTAALALLASTSLAQEPAKFYQETYPG